jgi:hypothetical protein
MDKNHLSVRLKVWSNIVAFNPPNLWVMINPPDSDPIAQVFVGTKINLDNFITMAGPDLEERARNIASDPFVSAKIFHFMITTLLEVVFGIKKSKAGIIRQS